MAKIVVGVIGGYEAHPSFSPPEVKDNVIGVVDTTTHCRGFISESNDNLALAFSYNSIVSFVLSKYPEATHIFFLHNDVSPPSNVPILTRLRLINEANSNGKNIVGALSLMQLPPHYPQVFLRDHGLDYFRMLIGWSEGSIMEVDALTMACTLVPIEVFKAFQYPWFDVKQKSSCDLWFCTQAQILGYRIICDTTSVCERYYMGKSITINDFKHYQQNAIELSRKMGIKIAEGDPLKRLPPP